MAVSPFESGMKKTIPTLADQATQNNIDFHLYSAGSAETVAEVTYLTEPPQIGALSL